MSARTTSGVKRRNGAGSPDDAEAEERRGKMPRRSDDDDEQFGMEAGSGISGLMSPTGSKAAYSEASDSGELLKDSVERRRAQVREASRRFRERKKLEIGHLEEKTGVLEQELVDTKSQLVNALSRVRFLESHLEQLNRSLESSGGAAAPLAANAALQMQLDDLKAKLATKEAELETVSTASRGRSRRQEAKEQAATITATQYQAIFNRLQVAASMNEHCRNVIQEQQTLLRVLDMHLRSGPARALLPGGLPEAVAMVAWRPDRFTDMDICRESDLAAFAEPLGRSPMAGSAPGRMAQGFGYEGPIPQPVPQMMYQQVPMNQPQLYAARLLPEPAAMAGAIQIGGGASVGERQHPSERSASPMTDTEDLSPMVTQQAKTRPAEVPLLPLGALKHGQGPSLSPYVGGIIKQAVGDVCCFANESWAHVVSMDGVVVFHRPQDQPIFSLKYETVVPDVPADVMSQILWDNFTDERTAKEINPDTTQKCQILQQLDPSTVVVRRTDRYTPSYLEKEREYVYVVHALGNLTLDQLKHVSKPTPLPISTRFDEVEMTACSPRASRLSPSLIKPDGDTRYYVGIVRSIVPDHTIPVSVVDGREVVRADMYEGWVIRSAFNGRGSVVICVGQVDPKQTSGTLAEDDVARSLQAIVGYVQNTVQQGRRLYSSKAASFHDTQVFGQMQAAAHAAQAPHDNGAHREVRGPPPRKPYATESSIDALSMAAEQLLDRRAGAVGPEMYGGIGDAAPPSGILQRVHQPNVSGVM